MTDHLEPYRRLARSICFVPPQWQAERFYRTLTQPAPKEASASRPVATPVSPIAKTSPDVGPTPDPSEYIAALVQEAVSKPTVLPIAYAIPENIGDRISKLTDSQVSTTLTAVPVIPTPKLPEPDPNWVPASQVPVVEVAPSADLELTPTVTAEPATTAVTETTSGFVAQVEVETIAEPAAILTTTDEAAPGLESVVTSSQSPAPENATPEVLSSQDNAITATPPATSQGIETLQHQATGTSQSQKHNSRKAAQGFSPSPSKKKRK